MTSATGPLTLVQLDRDPLIGIFADESLTALDLCTSRLVCQIFQLTIDSTEQNPIWMNIAIREGLHLLTPEEKNTETHQQHVQKNWSFCLLRQKAAEPTPPPLTQGILDRISAAIRLGHSGVSCQCLDTWKRDDRLRQQSHELAMEAIDAGQFDPFIKLLSRHKNWIISAAGGNKNGFMQTALRGRVDMMDVYISILHKKEPFLSTKELLHAFYFAASRGDFTMLKYLLDSYPETFTQKQFDSAYFQALVFSPSSETIEFLRSKASAEIQKKTRESLEEFYKNQFCDGWLQLDPISLLLRAEFYLAQSGFFQNLTEAQRNKIVKGLKACHSSELLCLFISHSEFSSLIAADQSVLHVIMTDIFHFRDRYPTAALIPFLTKIKRAHEEAVFKSYAASLLYSSMTSGKVEFLEAFVKHFPELIPEDLFPLFLEMAKSRRDTDGKDNNAHIRLIDVCKERPQEMGWFLKSLSYESLATNS